MSEMFASEFSLGPTRQVHDVLIDDGLITRDDYDAAVIQAGESDKQPAQILIEGGLVTKKDVFRATVTAAGMEFLDFMDVTIEPAASSLITGDQARKYQVIPYKIVGNTLHVAADSKTAVNWQVADDLRTITKFTEIKFSIAMKPEISQRLNQTYRAEAEIASLLRDMVNVGNIVDLDDDATANFDAPLVRYVNLILVQAISDAASDIHVEPTEHNIRVRYRIDGVLKTMAPAPKEIQSAIISRLKIMCEMDISEKRRPQDGRLSIMHEGKKMDLRVSCMPTVWGEKIVMRILDNTTASLGLPDLGFSLHNLEIWKRAYERPHGLIIVSGPTGSGKSTTLYATVNALVRPEVNIITVEDPVEYRIDGINQVQVNTKAGLTFASSLRAILRADPDIILIGEIRDHETAQIAIEAALTGHLVLSTLHTNDAPSVITRLTEMGIEPFLVGSSLTCASGQRLTRRLCQKCRIEVYPTSEELESVGFSLQEGLVPTFFEPAGCVACAQTGYRGRIGLHELMWITDEIGALAIKKSSAEEIHACAIEQGMISLREDGWLKVGMGLTTIAEVLRVVA
jgi:type IV pilus assembly protein PilB